MADGPTAKSPLNAAAQTSVETLDMPDPSQPGEFAVQTLFYGAGVAAHLPLSRFSLLQPQIKAQLFKAEFMDLAGPSEAVLQSFAFPLADFTSANPEFDPARLTTIRFIFDRTPAGVVILDGIGFRE